MRIHNHIKSKRSKKHFIVIIDNRVFFYAIENDILKQKSGYTQKSKIRRYGKNINEMINVDNYKTTN